MDDRNLSMLADFYQFTMGNGYFESGMKDTTAYFDMFFRKIPDGGGFAIMAGLEQLIDYLEKLSFTEEDIEFLRKKNLFSEGFLDYLKNFKFECDVWAIPEGTPIFPYEPIVTVVGPIIQCQLIETMVLLNINHQTLIATKASRISRAAKGKTVMEFGSRRAQGFDAAMIGARAAYIGGCSGTACTISEMKYGVPALGTMAHSWVQSFDDEYEAFQAYCNTYPDSSVLLVDTYNVLKSGVPNAIRAAKRVLEPKGFRLKGIRIDSGDIAYLSIKAREMLDSAGMSDCKIVASSGLDEYLIRDIINQGAKVDQFGVGENLITSHSSPVFGGVYKLVAIEENGKLISKIKVSENPEKITTPGFKKLIRFYDKDTNMVKGDLLCLRDEEIDESKPYTLFHPVHIWKKTVVENYYTKEMLVRIFDKGKMVYDKPSLVEIRDKTEKEIEGLWKEMLRFEYPQKYYVDLSRKLWSKKMKMLGADITEDNKSSLKI